MTCKDWCRQHTQLTESQTAWVCRLAELIPFAATASHQEVVLYVFATDENATSQLLILAACQATGQSQQDPYRAGQLLSQCNVPTWWEMQRVGTPYTAKEERGGQLASVYFFPIVDNGGRLLGGVRFLDCEAREESTFLAETAAMAITAPDSTRSDLYSPLAYQDGLLIFDEGGYICYGNEAARHLGDLLGLPKPLVGASVFGGTIKLSRVKQWLRKHQAEAAEELYGSLVLRQRVLPVVRGGKVVRSYLILEDRTVQHANERALLVKNSIIKEIHHRVKNNLQTVTSLLRLQARRAEQVEVQEALQESIHRMESLSLVHDMLCHYGEEAVEVSQIWAELVRLLRKSMSRPGQQLAMEYRGDTIDLSASQAPYVSLVLNELLLNAFEHAFAKQEQGHLILEGTRLNAHTVRLRLIDDGPGPGPDFESRQHERLGLQILRTLVEGQLEGELSFSKTEPTGLTVTMVFRREI